MHADVGLIERETAHGTVSQAKLSIDHNVRAFLRARSTDAPAWVNTLWADAYNDAATGRIIATTDEQQPAAPATPRAPTPGSVCEYPELDFGEVFAAEPLVSPEGRQSLLASPVVESPSASDTDEPDYIADHLSTLGTGFEYQPQPVTAAAAAEAAAASGVAAMRSLHAAMWTGDLLPYDVYAVHRATAKTRYAVSRAAYDLACSRPSSPVAALQLGDAYADVRPDKHYLSDDDDDDCADAETSDPESDYTGGGGGGGGETSELSDEEYVRAAATVEAIASGLAAKQRATRHYKRKKRSTGDYTMGYVW